MRTHSRRFVLLVALGLVVTGCGKMESSGGQTTFKTPDEAVAAFVAAARANDTKALAAMLGPDGADVVTSTDTIADMAERARFVERFDEKHDIVEDGPDHATLNVGATEWPLPIPLVKVDDKWHWDGAAGKEEIFFRRIGHYELKAIAAVRGAVAAEQEYAATSHDGQPAGTYARRIISQPGTQNGLYWAAQQGEPESPLGPAIAAAGGEGYDTTGAKTPYHGYYYRLLPNGTGFGIVAFPADYRESGVMTFQSSESGEVFQKDLGDSTSALAQALTSYAVDSTWTVVKDDD
jgi:hypothetical protein